MVTLISTVSPAAPPQLSSDATTKHRLGVFLVHGLFGHPDEYRALASNLQSLGYHTQSPSLLAHGARCDVSLDEVMIEDLIAEVEADFEQFTASCDRVVLLGHSLGGLLSALLAAKQPDNLKALVMVAAPYERAYTINGLTHLMQLDLSRFFPALRYVHQGRTGLPRPKFKPWWKRRLADEALALFDLAKPRLNDINVPVWLLHSPYDLVVPYEEMMALANAIDKPELVTMQPLSKCGHQVFPTSVEQLTVMNTLLQAIDVALKSEETRESAF